MIAVADGLRVSASAGPPRPASPGRRAPRSAGSLRAAPPRATTRPRASARQERPRTALPCAAGGVRDDGRPRGRVVDPHGSVLLRALLLARHTPCLDEPERFSPRRRTNRLGKRSAPAQDRVHPPRIEGAVGCGGAAAGEGRASSPARRSEADPRPPWRPRPALGAPRSRTGCGCGRGSPRGGSRR